MGMWRSRWAAVGAAVAVACGAGGVGLVDAGLDTGDRPVTVTVEPERILDTRVALGLSGKFQHATPRDLQVTGSVPVASGGSKTVVPADAVGVLVNVTVVLPSDAGFLSLRPAGATGVPETSTVNFFPFTIEPNSATVDLSADGKIQIWVQTGDITTGTADVLVDVVGYTIDHTHDDRYYTETEVDDLLDDVVAGTFVGYENVIVVAKSGGDFTSVGVAVDAIGVDPEYPAASATQRYLVWVAPGLYDDEYVVMKPYVDIEGSGQGVTVLRSIGGDTWIGASSATVVGADDAELRDLTVEIEPAAATHMTHAIFTEGSTTLRNVTANAVGGNYARGLMIHTGASPLMIDVIARASGGSQSNLGVDIYRATAVADGLFVEARGGSEATGIFVNEGSSEVQFENVTTRVSDGTNQTHGLKTNLSDVTLEGYRTTVSSLAPNTIGAWCDDQGRSMKLRDATISVSTGAGAGTARGVYGSSCNLEVRNAVVDVSSGGGTARGIQHHQVTGTTLSADVQIADVEVRAASGSAASYGVLLTAATGAAETHGRVTHANVLSIGGSPAQSSWGIRHDAPGELRYRGLLIHAQGSATFLYGIQAPRGAATFDDVVIDTVGEAEATAVGAELYGDGSSLSNARVRAINFDTGTGHDAVGIKANSATNVSFTDVTAYAEAETNVWGADLFNSETTATRVDARAVSTDAAVGAALGFRCIGGSSNVRDSIMHATSATGTSYGYRIDGCNTSVHGAEMIADGGVTNYGVSFTTTTAHTATVKQSALVGSTNAIVTAGPGVPDLVVQDSTFSGGASLLSSGTQSCTAIVSDSGGIVFTPGPVSPCP